MEFTFEAYRRLVEKICVRGGYRLAGYKDYHCFERPCILRHDVDMDVQAAEKFAQMEAQIGIKSTYFILLSSDFYNICSQTNLASISHILELGHTVGLHFDEVKYRKQLDGCEIDAERIEKIKSYIIMEMKMMGDIIGCSVNTVSMHRPSKLMLDADIEIPGAINSYGKTFFKDFKYVSDSRMHWRENVEEIVESRQYNALHVLTHPFSHSEKPLETKDHLYGLFQNVIYKTYQTLNDNFRDLEEFITEDEILYRMSMF